MKKGRKGLQESMDKKSKRGKEKERSEKRKERHRNHKRRHHLVFVMSFLKDIKMNTVSLEW